MAQQFQQLTVAMARTEAQLEQSQHELQELRRQVAALEQRMATTGSETPPSRDEASSAAQLAAQVEELREQQSLQESEIATQEQSKVESESKYPVKLSGLILMSGFVNTQRVDIAATPTAVVGGGGSTGLSLLQTVLGADARGPHLFGARSFADVRVDFDGSASTTVGYSGSIGLLRLRTAHAGLEWMQTQAFFSLDRPIISPNTPSSLTAVAVPALAWSGNLWFWNPQLGVSHDLWLSTSQRLRMQAALIDVADAPAAAGNVSVSTPVLPLAVAPAPPTAAEQSRWPGLESRLAILSSQEHGAQVGVGGFFAPHRSPAGTHFDAWAGTLDYHLPLPARLEFSGSAYRGQSLGGLGGGGYKDYAYYFDGEDSYFRALDDMGGWAQLKERASERLEFNAALGIDNVPAGQLRPYASQYSTTYQNLARNRTFTANVIYSPSAYLLFSLEYRRIDSSPVNAPTAGSNIIGVAAGYKF